MIEKDQVMDMLVEACPSYKKRHEQYKNENYEPDDERLIYLEISDFTDHLIELFRSGRIEEFNNVFDFVERMHLHGSEEVKELATIGFLEDLQNGIQNQNINDHHFISYLRPESLIWWNHLNDFWNGKTEFVGGPLKEKRLDLNADS